MDMIDIATWANDDIKSILCTQDVLGTKFQLKVRQFSPVQGDSLARKWKKNGKEKSFECPPYAIASMKEAAQTLATFVDKTMGSAICFYIDETDKLMRDTFMMAYRQSKFAQVRSYPHGPALSPTMACVVRLTIFFAIAGGREAAIDFGSAALGGV